MEGGNGTNFELVLSSNSVNIMDDEETKIFYKMDIIVSVVVAFFNLIEIIILKRLGRKLKIYELFLLSLSYSDLLFAISNISISCTEISIKKFIKGYITYTIYFLFVTTSIFHLNAIALDRLWAIYRPIQHKVMVTNRRVRILLSVIWLSCTTAAISLMLYGKLSPMHKSVIEFSTLPNDSINQNETSSASLNKVGDSFTKLTQNTLSYFIVVADISLALTYAFIIYHIQTIQQDSEKTKISMNNERYKGVLTLCIWITIGFLALTMPFPIYYWSRGEITSLVKMLLVVNSGVNSLAYLVRSDHKQILKASSSLCFKQQQNADTMSG